MAVNKQLTVNSSERVESSREYSRGELYYNVIRNTESSSIVERFRVLRSRIISVRFSDEDVASLISIMAARGHRSISSAVREAVRVYASLLGRAEAAIGASIVIQNPVINIQEVVQEVRQEVKQEVTIDAKLVEVVTKLYKYREGCPPLQRDLIARLYRVVAENA